jgi:ketosteroid isomerase-like protein
MSPPSGPIDHAQEEETMGEAREVMDRVTAAAFETKDFKAAAECYAEDAVAVTPDQGEITGRDAIAEYLRQFADAFPDLRYEYVAKHESGNVAIDEGYATGTNTAPLPMPSGKTIPATGKQVRVRGCDIATIEGGLITSHRLYFDQMEFLGQLGLLPDMPS